MMGSTAWYTPNSLSPSCRSMMGVYTSEMTVLRAMDT